MCIRDRCTSCSRGCNVNVGGYKDRVWRLTPRRNDAVNDTWMCDHGRLNIDFCRETGIFLADALGHAD